MLPTEDELLAEAKRFAEARFNYTVHGVARSSFIDGAEWLLSQLCDKDDVSRRLSDAYSSLKVKHWDIKVSNEQLKKDNADLRQRNIELRAKYFDIVERMQKLEPSDHTTTSDDML